MTILRRVSSVREARAEAVYQRLLGQVAIELSGLRVRTADDLVRSGRATILVRDGRSWLVLAEAAERLLAREASA